jgi:hypothetical protein
MNTYERKTEIIAEFQRHLKGKPNHIESVSLKEIWVNHDDADVERIEVEIEHPASKCDTRVLRG